MSAIGNLFTNIFGSAPATTPAPTGSQTPGTPAAGTQASPGTDNNGVVPAGAQGSETTPASPLDAFKDIWNTAPSAQETANNTSLFADLDPAKVMESARRVDFSKSVTPETLAKIQAGGPDAAQAFMAAMNSVAQTSYAQSAIATTKIVEQALAKQQERNDANLPTLVKKFSANENLLADNPLLKNPAIQPLVNALQEQLVRKNPQASTADIQSQVQEYFAGLAQTFAPKKAEVKVQASEDWDKFFN